MLQTFYFVVVLYDAHTLIFLMAQQRPTVKVTQHELAHPSHKFYRAFYDAKVDLYFPSHSLLSRCVVSTQSNM